MSGAPDRECRHGGVGPQLGLFTREKKGNNNMQLFLGGGWMESGFLSHSVWTGNLDIDVTTAYLAYRSTGQPSAKPWEDEVHPVIVAFGLMSSHVLLATMMPGQLLATLLWGRKVCLLEDGSKRIQTN